MAIGDEPFSRVGCFHCDWSRVGYDPQALTEKYLDHLHEVHENEGRLTLPNSRKLHPLNRTN